MKLLKVRVGYEFVGHVYTMYFEVSQSVSDKIIDGLSMSYMTPLLHNHFCPELPSPQRTRLRSNLSAQVLTSFYAQ